MVNLKMNWGRGMNRIGDVLMQDLFSRSARNMLWLLILVIAAPRWVAAEILPEDPAVHDLKFVDGTKRYAKKVYLRDYFLKTVYSIDVHRFVASVIASKNFDGQPNNTPKVVIVDTESGEVKDTGYVGEIRCYSEGRIATVNVGTSTSSEAMYFGKLGESLQKYPLWSPDMELNWPSCQLLPRWKYPKFQQEETQLLTRLALKPEHGAVFVYQPKAFPVLELSSDANNRAVFIRSGANAVPPLQVYLEQPSGHRIDIPVNPGEKINAVQYIPFENAYWLNIVLNNTQPIKSWAPRFGRLLYPDGTVKRFSVPPPIVDLIKAGKAVATTTYTKRGAMWELLILPGHPDVDHLQGNYLVLENELVKIPAGGVDRLNGCKLLCNDREFFSKLYEYYFINICTGEQ